MWEYRARLSRVTDGDTVRLVIDLGMRVQTEQAIRILGIDAPELGTDEGRAAREFALAWCEQHAEHVLEDEPDWPFTVRTIRDRKSFDRYLGELRCREQHDYASAAVHAAMAVWTA